jgi:hypothetical protein
VVGGSSKCAGGAQGTETRQITLAGLSDPLLLDGQDGDSVSQKIYCAAGLQPQKPVRGRPEGSQQAYNPSGVRLWGR